MRIIGGKFKRKKLIIPIDKKTRPLKDLVKESIFNLIQHSNKFNVKIENSRILDLFSGSGSFGLETISRGAKIVYFFENYSGVLEILKKNIFNLNCDQNSKIFEEDCFKYFEKNKTLINDFDIIFIDPPYKENKINNLISFFIKKKFLKKNGIIIVHRHKKDLIKITKDLKILDERNYGISKIIIGN